MLSLKGFAASMPEGRRRRGRPRQLALRRGAPFADNARYGNGRPPSRGGGAFSDFFSARPTTVVRVEQKKRIKRGGKKILGNLRATLDLGGDAGAQADSRVHTSRTASITAH
jgi:hypothetical protein